MLDFDPWSAEIAGLWSLIERSLILEVQRLFDFDPCNTRLEWLWSLDCWTCLALFLEVRDLDPWGQSLVVLFLLLLLFNVAVCILSLCDCFEQCDFGKQGWRGSSIQISNCAPLSFLTSIWHSFAKWTRDWPSSKTLMDEGEAENKSWSLELLASELNCNGGRNLIKISLWVVWFTRLEGLQI